jgi:hypothetical protein
MIKWREWMSLNSVGCTWTVYKPVPKDFCREPPLHDSLYRTPKPESVIQEKIQLQDMRGFLQTHSNLYSNLLGKVPSLAISVVCISALKM